MKLKAIISTTFEDKYFFFLPLTVFAWNKIGAQITVMCPKGMIKRMGNKVHLMASSMPVATNSIMRFNEFKAFECPENKEATYSQVSRLFGGCFSDVDDDSIIMVSDMDMLPLQGMCEHLENINGDFHVLGADLVPPGQFPMCYISASKQRWKIAMRCGSSTYQEMLDHHLGHEEMENMRGNLWSRDQELAWSMIAPQNYVPHDRAKPGTQFATRRYDRDDAFFLERLSPMTIDYHMPRPGYEEKNFEQIMTVLKYHYPDENFDWLVNYRNEYVKLL